MNARLGGLVGLLLIAAAPARPPTAEERAAADATRGAKAASTALLDATGKLRATEDALAAAETDLAAIDARAAVLSTQVAQQSAALLPLLAFAARMAVRPWAGWLANPASPRDAARGLLVIQAIGAELRARTATLGRAQDELRVVREQAAARRDGVLDARKLQQVDAAKLDASLARARITQASTAYALADAQRRAAADAARTVSLPAAVHAVTAAKPVLATIAGRWVVPVAGARVGAFGAATDSGPATGLRFAPPSAARVVAPCDGQTVFAAPFRSYGGLVIVACAGGLHAVLTGLDRIDVKLGQPVSAGTPAGVMRAWDANHPPRDRPSLTLQALRDGSPIDPASLLR